MIRRWLPRHISTQLLLITLCGLILVQLLSLQIYRLERSDTLSLVNSRHAMLQLAAVVNLLNTAPPDQSEQILRASRSETLMLRLKESAWTPPQRDPRFEARLTRLLEVPTDIRISAELMDPAQLPPPPEGRPPWMERGHGRVMALRDARLYGSIKLANGQWLIFSTFQDKEPPAWSPRHLLSLLLVGGLIGLLLIWLIRRITHPLKQLARQAEQFGRGERLPPLTESGPDEVRETLAAFNRMQSRLDRFVQDRTQMLAAISHDLRTPLTSLQLRCEFLPEGEDRQRMLQTLGQMEQMIRATLHFAREDQQQTPRRDVDLVSLLHSLCDDYEDAGQAVSCQAEGKQVYACHPDSLRRAVQNLVDNALKYAGSAEVSLTSGARSLQILVCDRGPGIPEEQLEQVFKPFVRGDTARNTEDGSVGLGLSIARTLVHQHGGELQLCNRAGGGLEACLQLPR
ncbi:ATP-binding protein [Pseudaeromonas sp. ZJS20]|uniref:ATP-binding protein n=1 Tax=Pseudaeromonas aegiceratis TaxID=3153928 RepID=UPI00390CBA0C